MRIQIIETGVHPGWPETISALSSAFQTAGWNVERGGPALWEQGDNADVYLIAAGRDEEYGDLLVARSEPQRLQRTILMGCDLGWEFGTYEQPPGTLAHLLEQHHLGGAFRTKALLAWQEAPSPFVGPCVLMTAMHTNAFKGFQSENYCAWFSAPGATLAEFLMSFLPVLDRFATTGDSSVKELGQ